MTGKCANNCSHKFWRLPGIWEILGTEIVGKECFWIEMMKIYLELRNRRQKRAAAAVFDGA